MRKNNEDGFRKYRLTLLFLWLVLCFAYSQKREYVTYTESFTMDAEMKGITASIQPKTARLNSQSVVNFKIQAEEDVPDSVKKCLEVATDIWRSCLDNNSNYGIRLQLKWESLTDDADTKIDVCYSPGDVYYPTSLYCTLYGDLGDSGSPDAVITVNKDKAWDCGFNTENTVRSRSMVYAMLRGVAIALGFGTSVKRRNNGVDTYPVFGLSRGHSAFDTILFSEDGTWLKDIPNKGMNKNLQLTNFVQKGNGDVYALKHDAPYKMYVPSVYKNGNSLKYLDNESSLMYHVLDMSTKKMRVDSVTVNLLHAIGWNLKMPERNFSLRGEGIDDTGIASAYETHRFYLEGDGTERIKDGKWSYVLPLADGTEMEICHSTGNVPFDIPKIEDDTQYQINVNGDIYGKIIFTGICNGELLRLVYNLTLELKPRILSVNTTTARHTSNSYDAICCVDYRGCDYLYVTVEEEYGTTLRSQYVKEPYLAHFICDHITSPYYAWIDIVAENKYGKDTYTIEMPPMDETVRRNSTAGVERTGESRQYTSILVYDMGGKLVTSLENLSDANHLLSGMYILKFLQNNEIVKTVKLMHQ